jgi:SAM-dependent methyltransferase
MDRSCNACGCKLGGGLHKVKDPQSLEEFEILECVACGLGHTSPIPEDLGAYYGDAYYGKRHSFTDEYCRARRLRMLTSVSKRSAPGRLLDVGCGDGSFLRAAVDRGWTGAGVEIGRAAELSRERGLNVFDTLDDVAKAKSAPFDAATMWHTLEHFPDPAGTLASIRPLLAADAVFIVAVPDAAGLQASLFGGSWFHLDVPRHLYHFNRSNLEALLRKSGFRVNAWQHQEVELDVFGWMQSALNAMLPAPNVLFQSLTGKPSHGGPTTRALSYALGSVLAPAALAATAVGTATKRGATLIACCSPA